MSPRVRKTAAVVSSAVLVGGGGVAAVAAASTGKHPKQDKLAGAAPYGNGYGSGGPGPGRGGPGGVPSDQAATIAKALGVTTDQLQAAITAARPDKGQKPDGDGRAAELATALGVDASKVEAILDANKPTPPSGTAKPDPSSAPQQGYGSGPGGPGGHGPGVDGGRPGMDDSKLIAALATGLSIDQATVKAAFEKIAAAHEADHSTQETAFYAAIAKTLGVDASKVQQAFEAARPTPPTPPTGG
jgi:LysM repeat protein